MPKREPMPDLTAEAFWAAADTSGGTDACWTYTVRERTREPGSAQYKIVRIAKGPSAEASDA